jgi:hypothetical protein
MERTDFPARKETIQMQNTESVFTRIGAGQFSHREHREHREKCFGKKLGFDRKIRFFALCSLRSLRLNNRGAFGLALPGGGAV